MASKDACGIYLIYTTFTPQIKGLLRVIYITLWPCGQGYIMILPSIQDISLITIYTRLIACYAGVQANSLVTSHSSQQVPQDSRGFIGVPI